MLSSAEGASNEDGNWEWMAVVVEVHSADAVKENRGVVAVAEEAEKKVEVSGGGEERGSGGAGVEPAAEAAAEAATEDCTPLDRV